MSSSPLLEPESGPDGEGVLVGGPGSSTSAVSVGVVGVGSGPMGDGAVVVVAPPGLADEPAPPTPTLDDIEEARGAALAAQSRPPPAKKRRGRPPKQRTTVADAPPLPPPATNPVEEQTVAVEMMPASLAAPPPGGSLDTRGAVVASSLSASALVLLYQGPALVRGFASYPRELGDALASALVLGRALKGEVSLSTKAVARELLQEAWHFKTSRSMEATLQQDRKTIATQTKRLAAFLFLYQRCQFRVWCESLFNKLPRKALIGHFEIAGHDETPMKIRVDRDPGEGHLPTSSANPILRSSRSVSSLGSVGTLCELGGAGGAALSASSVGESQKLVQTMLSVATMVRCSDTLFALIFPQFCPTYVVRSATIANLMTLQQRVSPTTPVANVFDLQQVPDGPSRRARTSTHCATSTAPVAYTRRFSA